MAKHPDVITINGTNYTIESQAAWVSVSSQLETLVRTGSIMLSIPQGNGHQYVWVSSGTSLEFWDES